MFRNRYLTRQFGIIVNYSEESSCNFKRKSFHLQNYKSLLKSLQLIPKNLKITTQNGSSKFNIDILKLASPVILQFTQSNSEKSEYHLDFDDNQNVLSKLEQLYQGNPVIIENDEIQPFQQIAQNLKIQLNKPYTVFNQHMQYKPTKAIIDLASLIDLLKSNTTFTIKTKSKEYKCNRIGINLSTKIREFLVSNPTADTYSYDFQDEFDEFQLICDFFNFKTFSVTTDNMDSIRKIAEELQINFLLNETGDFFDKYDKFYEIIDEQQESIDEIDELFDLLTNIEYKTVKFVKESIFQSKWSKKEEDVQELGAFILQVIDSNMILHRYLIDLLIQLNSESTEQSKLKILLPLIVDNLMDSFGTNIQNCSFIYLLYKKEIISKQDLLKSIYNKSFSYEIDVNRLNQINDTNENNNPNINDGPLYNYGSTVNKGKKIEVELIKVNTPILLWFLPEIIEINNLTSTDKLRGYGTVVDSFIKKYFDQIDLYKKMRDNGEPNDELTMALRHDDVDKFQSIISVSRSNIENGIVPYNIYEEFVPNGKTKYLNYASAYGSIKCFKYLLLNHIQVDKQTFKFAVYGGNIEIIKIVDQKYQDDDILNKNDDDDRQRNDRTRFFQSYNKCLFIRTKSYFSIDKNLISEFMNKVVLDKRFTYSIVPSIVRHQNDLFDWVLEKNVAMKSIDKDSFTDLIIISYESGNVHSLIELFDRYFKYIKEILAVNEKETSLISDMIQTICQNGFYLLTKIILKAFESILPNDQQDILVPAFNNRKGFYFNNSNLYDPLKIYPPRKKNDCINVISFGNLSILKLFIPKYDQYTLESILLYAILNNNLNVVTYFFDDLVKKNVFQITKDNYEYFILYSLFQKSDYLFNYLIEKIKEIDSSFVVKWSISLVKNATFSNNVQLSKYISDIVFKESPKEDFFIPFMNAVSSNSVELCKYFIDKKVFISFKKLKNHVISISKANKEIFSILMNVIPQEKMKKINEHIYVNAITHNNVDVVEIILKTIPSINHGLFEAVENSNLEIVKLILKNNSSPKFVNKRTPKGSPLNFAVHNNNLEIVKELLSVPGIDASLCDKSGNTPLIEAFNNKNIDILNSILDFYGNDIQCQSWQLDFLVQKISQNMNKTSYNNVIDRILDIKGIYMHPTNGLNNYEHINSLLLNACMKNDVNFVSKLLSLDKIDVNMYQPVTGNTVLIEAILNDNIEIANLLIKYPKTNINFRNNSDQTPLTIAVQNNMNSIIELLLNDEKFDKDDSLFNYAFSISTGETTKIFLNSKYLDINDKIYTIQNQPFEIKKRKKWESKIYRLNNDTLLIDAAKNQNEYLIDLIINHPSFDKKKSKLNDAIFASLENPRDTNIFKKLIGIVDIDKFNKYQNDNKGLLHNIVSPQTWGNTNKIASEFLTIALENSNFVFSKTDLNSTFRSIFRELRITNSSKTFFTTNNLEKLITYDRSHNNYIDINCNDNDKTYFTTLDYDTNKDLILKLIEFGADPNIPDGYGILPLQYSFYIGTSECIRIFIQSNKIDFNKRILDVKMNMKNSNSSYYSSNLYKYYSTNKYTAQKQIKNHITYLHLAARYYDPEILKIFLDDKLIDVNVTDDLGNTPLIDACKFNRGNNVELLFQIDNLDFLHCNKEGKDALHILDTSLPDDDRTIKDKNEYLKKLMTLLDRDKNNPKDKRNSNVWGKKPEFKFQTFTWSDKANTSINSKYTKKMSWAAISNSSKTNINTPSNPPDLIKTPDLPNETSTSISFNQENKPKQSWGMKSNSSAKKNWPQKPAFSKTSNPPDLIKISDSSDKTSESESSFGIKSTSSDQTNTFKSSDSLITSNKQIQLNHASLMDDESPKKKQFSNSIDQSHELLRKINHIDDEKFEEPSSNEENINSQMHSKMMERSCTQLSDIESQILLEYPMTNEDQQNPQYLINNQSLIAQQQMNQMLYINQINQMQFYQQMMMQANFLNALKHHKSKRKKKSKH